MTKGLQWSIPISQRITTDASFWGWGAHLKQHSSTGKQRLHQIRGSFWRYKEPWKHFKTDVRGHNLQILVDNIATVVYLNKQGGTRSRIHQFIAQGILSWAEGNLAFDHSSTLKKERKIAWQIISAATRCVETIGPSTRRFLQNLPKDEDLPK